MTVKSGTLAIGDIISAHFNGEVLLGTTSRGSRQFTGFDFGIVTYISRSEQYGVSIGVKVFDADSSVWTIMLNSRCDVDVLVNIRNIEPSDELEDDEVEEIESDSFHIQYSKLRGQVYVLQNNTDQQLLIIDEISEGRDFSEMSSEQIWWYVAKEYGSTIHDLIDSVNRAEDGVFGEC